MMGLGDFLRSLFSAKSSAVRRNDKIWLTQGAKLRGIVRDVERALDEKTIPLVVAHFPNMLRGMQTLLEGTDRPFEILEKSVRLQEWTDRLTHHDPPRVFLTESTNLPEPVEASDSARDDSKTVSIIVIESHPLPAGDEAIERFAESLPCRCRLQIHLSLDDAVMQVFVSESMVEMLRNLGMKDDEAIESRMVTRRIHNARRKIERVTVGSEPAESVEEWFRVNCPGVLKKYPIDGLLKGE